MMQVTSNNGTIHFAEKKTKRKSYPGYVRKMCDGQWVPESRSASANGKVNCKACSKGQSDA